jgi:hypothetical protein
MNNLASLKQRLKNIIYQKECQKHLDLEKKST